MATLKYGVDEYNVEISSQRMTPAEARAEYNRLRNIANKRLWNLQKSAYKEFDVVTENVGKFIGPTKLTESELYRNLQDVARFVSSSATSVTGIKSMLRKEVQTLQKHGYSYVNMSNILEFREFWKEIRAHNDIGGVYDPSITDLFNLAQKKNVDPASVGKAFEYWSQHSKEIEQAPAYNRKSATSAKNFQKLMKQRKRRKANA